MDSFGSDDTTCVCVELFYQMFYVNATDKYFDSHTKFLVFLLHNLRMIPPCLLLNRQEFPVCIFLAEFVG